MKNESIKWLIEHLSLGPLAGRQADRHPGWESLSAPCLWEQLRVPVQGTVPLIMSTSKNRKRFQHDLMMTNTTMMMAILISEISSFCVQPCFSNHDSTSQQQEQKPWQWLLQM